MGPITALGRALLFGFVFPFAIFLTIAYLWTWLFPGSVLAPSLDADKMSCRAPPGDVLAFVWSHFWRGTAINLPDAFSWHATAPLDDLPKRIFVIILRLFMSFAGTLSLGQLAWELFGRQCRSLIKTLRTPIDKILKQRHSATQDSSVTSG